MSDEKDMTPQEAMEYLYSLFADPSEEEMEKFRERAKKLCDGYEIEKQDRIDRAKDMQEELNR